MKILILEPYFTGSHKQWALGYKKYSKHEVKILSMKGQFWKWRMHGGAVTLAKQFKNKNYKPDLILSTDMLDLSTFLALTKTKARSAIYFHENQLSYPWSPNDRDLLKKRDHHYSFINYVSALSADHVLFNSRFHMEIFIKKLHSFLNHFPDHNEIDTIKNIEKKSEVLSLAIELKKFDSYKYAKHNKPLILWNHRWEYDKNPELFFKSLKYLKDHGYNFDLAVLGENFSNASEIFKNAKDVFKDNILHWGYAKNPELFFKSLKHVKDHGYNFDLAVLGENFSNSPEIFKNAKDIFEENILHWGYAKNFDSYAKWLWKANILPVTSNQDFFGVSVMEAIYCEIYPLLPNRLSFPELIPEEFHCDHFYQNENDLNEKLISLIKNYKNRNSKALKKVVLKFDWNSLAPIYDAKMNSLLK